MMASKRGALFGILGFLIGVGTTIHVTSYVQPGRSWPSSSAQFELAGESWFNSVGILQKLTSVLGSRTSAEGKSKEGRFIDGTDSKSMDVLQLPRRERIRRQLEEAEEHRRRLAPLNAGGSHHVRLKTRKAGNSCWSKLEQRIFYHDLEEASSHALVRALLAYHELHADCIGYIKDWPSFVARIHEGKEDTGCNFIFWEPPAWHGVGNRIFSLVSAFIFALATDRVLLIPKDTFLAEYLCNPFDNSDWRIDNFKKTVHYVREHSKRLGELQSSDWNKKSARFDYSWNMHDYSWNSFCEAEMAALNQAKFVIVNSDQYFVPTLYFSSFLETKLNALFPDRKAFMHAARFLLHPVNSVWDRILRVYRGYLEHHHTLVGVQVRYFEDDGGRADIRSRIVDCAVKEAAYLPDVLPREEWRQVAQNPPEGPLLSPNGGSIGVFVTSLNGSHFDYFKAFFTTNKPRDASFVSVYSESHEGEEKQEVFEHYEAALVEMWLLSFCDKLITSDFSSFGHVASGLAGVTPFSLNVAIRKVRNLDWRTNGRPVCALASSEPCNLRLPPGPPLQCAGKDLLPGEAVEYVKPCAATNFGLGVMPLG